MSDAVTIRQAESEADVRAVAPLFEAYRAFYDRPSDAGGALDFLLERWRARQTVLFVAFCGERAAGFVHLFPSFTSLGMRRLWILNDLYVDEAHRRAGIARLLLRRAERHARETGAIGLTLSTGAENAKAQALYDSEGYKRAAAFLTFDLFFDRADDAYR